MMAPLRVKLPGSGLLCAVLFVLSGCAALEPVMESTVYPVVKYSAPDGSRLGVYLSGVSGNNRCAESAANIVDSVRLKCPQCIVTQVCTDSPDAAHRLIMSRASLDMPSLRTENGKVTMTVEARSPADAEGICRQIEQQSSAELRDAGLRCYSRGSAR